MKEVKSQPKVGHIGLPSLRVLGQLCVCVCVCVCASLPSLLHFSRMGEQADFHLSTNQDHITGKSRTLHGNLPPIPRSRKDMLQSDRTGEQANWKLLSGLR